jgi:GNAT superfamily N-acetyltransferase
VTPHVWVAERGHVDAVSSLLAGFRDHWGYTAPADADIRRTVGDLMEDGHTDFLLGAAAAGAESTGVCQLRYRLSVWTGADDCWLEDLFVGEDARGGGVGGALVEAALERARARGCRRIELDVNEENVRALDFYRRFDFTTEPKPPGRTLFMSRRLDP